MSAMWKIRHDGSPQHVEMPLRELQQALLDGHWEVTDQVWGPGEPGWKHIEDHPLFEEIVESLTVPPPKMEEEAHLDLNALIDVCLVLLVFYILVGTVAALQKRLEAPNADSSKPGLAVVTQDKVEQTMIHVTAKMEGGEPVIRIEKEKVEPHRLLAELISYVRRSKKTILLLEHDGEVTHETVCKIIDAAKGAQMNSVRMVVP